MGSEDKKFESYFHRAHHLVEELVSTYGKNLSLDENGEFNTFLKENHLSGELVDRLTSAEIHREYYDRLAQVPRSMASSAAAALASGAPELSTSTSRGRSAMYSKLSTTTLKPSA